jgi:hypothetical protein
MNDELPENERKEELTPETDDSAPEGRTNEPTSNAADDATDSADEIEATVTSGASTFELAPHGLPPEPVATDAMPIGQEPIAQSAPQDTAPASDPPPPSQGRRFHEIDWDQMELEPAFRDPQTGKPRMLSGRINQSGLELSDMVLGRRPVFEYEHRDPQADAGPQATGPGRSVGDDYPRHFPAQAPAAAGAVVSIEVRVALTPDAIEQISKGSLLKAAEFSRGETMVVARKLYELVNQLKDLEQQRRVIWGR